MTQRHCHVPLAATALGALVLLATACSGSTGPTVASRGGQSPAATATPKPGGLAFASCLRAHGIGNFPDPSASGASVITPASGIDLNSPQFQSAERACRPYAPQGGAAFAAAVADETDFLKFAVCMQHHGFPDFPEPRLVGSTAQLLRPATDSPAAWDPASPLFKAAWHTCAHYQPNGQPAEPPPDGSATPPAGNSA
jgi:hypothetical protein